MDLKSVKIPLQCNEGQLEANKRASALFQQWDGYGIDCVVCPMAAVMKTLVVIITGHFLF